jgi:predicted CoA-binding protein
VDDARLRTILATSPTIAVLGIHDEQSRPAYYVPEYLDEVGYQIYGVNPKLAGRELFGHVVVGSLAELPVSVDLIDVFRRSEWIPDHVSELVAARPRVVWMQLGVRSDVAAKQLEAAGIEVVMDRCTLAEHRRLRVGAPHRDH